MFKDDLKDDVKEKRGKTNKQESFLPHQTKQLLWELSEEIAPVKRRAK